MKFGKLEQYWLRKAGFTVKGENDWWDGHDRGIASAVWHVTLKYKREAMSRACLRHDRGFACDMTVANPRSRRRHDRGNARDNVTVMTVTMHPSVAVALGFCLYNSELLLLLQSCDGISRNM